MARTTDLLSHVANMAVGKLTATGAETHLCLGFQPDFAIIYNLTNPSLHLWFRTMEAASMVNIFNHADTQFGAISTAGIDEYAGGDAADGTNDFYLKGSTLVFTAMTSGDLMSEGLTLGTNSVLNSGSDVLHIAAFKMGV